MSCFALFADQHRRLGLAYLAKMDQYDVIEAKGTSRDRTYQSVSEAFDHIE